MEKESVNQKLVRDLVKQHVNVKKSFLKRLEMVSSHYELNYDISKIFFFEVDEFLEYFWNKQIVLEFVSEIGGHNPISHFERCIQFKDINTDNIYKLLEESGCKFQERVIITTEFATLINEKRIGLILQKHATDLYYHFCDGKNPIVNIQMYVVFRDNYISSMKTVRLQQDIENEIDKTFNDGKASEFEEKTSDDKKHMEFEHKIEVLY